MATKTADIVTRGAEDEVYDFTARVRMPDGKTAVRKAKAARKSDVVNALAAEGLIPLKVSGGPGVGLKTEIQVRKTAKHRSLVITTRMLATMFEAGLSPVESLDVVINDCEDLVLRNALTEVRERVINGEPLSKAMASQPAFPPAVINFVTAGEASGSIREAFERVADQYDAEDKLRSKVKKAMMYPLVVFAISGIIFVFLMLFLVPQFAATFTELGGPDAKLPLLTRMVVSASDIMRWALPLFLVLTVPAFFTYRANKNKEGVRQVVDPLKMKLPIFGNLFHKIALARFSRNLSGLLNAGVDRLEALTIASTTVGNIVMERAIMAARDAQQNGQPLIEPLKAEPLFPGMIIQMVEVGERSGKTGPMLAKAADIYDRDVDQITDNMAALIEPIFLVVLGVMITTIVLAIYLPYLSIGNMI